MHNDFCSTFLLLGCDFISIFKFNCGEPVKDIKKGHKSNRVKLFFEIFTRKFTHLVKLNFLFAVPAFASMLVCLWISKLMGHTSLFVFFLPILLLSPFVPGLAFVSRNYSREEHAFIWGDFWEAVKNNLLQSTINGIISYLLFISIIIAVLFVARSDSAGIIRSLALPLYFYILITFVFMQFYVPIMMVTFDLPLGKIYKNAFIFSIVGIKNNLVAVSGVSLVCAIFFALDFLLSCTALSLIILSMLLSTIAFSLTSFIITFSVYPIIEKYMMKERPSENNFSESVFKDI